MRFEPPTAEDAERIRRWGEGEPIIEIPCLERPFFAWMVRRDDGQTVGWVELFNVDFANRKAEAGVFLKEAPELFYWTFRRLRKAAFEEIGLHRIYTRIPESRRRSIELAKKMGFTLEGIEKDAWLGPRGYEDIWVLGLVAEG